MKRITIYAAMLCIAGRIMADERVLLMSTIEGETCAMQTAHIDSIMATTDSLLFFSPFGMSKVAQNDVLSLDFADSLGTEVSVHYNGNMAYVYNPFFLQGVKTSIDGAHVSVISNVSGTEIGYTLNGNSADGSFTMDGEYKCTLTLSGLNLTSRRGAAIDIECGKRIAVIVADGTENHLADCANGSQKACMVFKGHPEWNGTGTLNVAGNTNHAIKTKEYMQLKKGFGTLNITSAAGDGIHAGQYFQMNGGTLNISGTNGDGLQVEKNRR